MEAWSGLTWHQHTADSLRAHIEGALDVGATPQEIVEVILQVCLYAGFAAGTNAMLLVADVFKASSKPALPLPCRRPAPDWMTTVA